MQTLQKMGLVVEVNPIGTNPELATDISAQRDDETRTGFLSFHKEI